MPPNIRNAITIVFLFIVLLTAIAAVLSNLGIWGLDPDSNFAKTTLGAVLIEIVGALIVVWKSGMLSPSTVSALIQFSDHDSDDIDLNLDRCSYEIRNRRAKVVGSGRLSVVLGLSGWECKLPNPSDADDSITLKLIDKNGKIWEVRPFYPLSKEVEAIELTS